MAEFELEFLDEKVRTAANADWRRLWLAESLYVRRDPTAESALRTLATSATDPEVLLRAWLSLGQHALEANDLKAAIADLEQADRIRPCSATTEWRLGTLLEGSDPRRAIQLLTDALVHAPIAEVELRVHVATDLCRALLRVGEYEKCGDVLRNLKDVGGDLPPGLRAIADALPHPGFEER